MVWFILTFSPAPLTVPWYYPDLTELEIKAVKNSVRSGKINIRKFQREEQITKEEEKIKCAQEAQSQIKAVFVNGIRKRGGII